MFPWGVSGFCRALGHEQAILVHKRFAGQNISFPKRLLSKEFVHSEIIRLYDGNNAPCLARKYDYTYSWVMKIIKKHRNEGNV